MDSDPSRYLEFFSVPNNQTNNPVDRTFNLAGTSAHSSSQWDNMASLNLDAGVSGLPSTAPTTMSLDSFAQASASTGLTSMSRNSSSTSRPSSMYTNSEHSRPILPTRPPRTRDGHERKRSRLATDTTPFDSVDYWIQFDNEEGLGDIPEAETPKIDARGKGKARTQRITSTSRPPANTATTSVLSSSTVKAEEYIDDSALDKALSDDEEGFGSINLAEHLSKIDSAPPTDIPQREGLYSTPLSWERPQPGLRMDSLIGLNGPALLNEAEQRRLIAIAMNPGPSMGGLGSNLNLNGFGGMSSGFNPTLAPALGLGLGSSPASSMSQATAGTTPVPPAQSRPGPPPPPNPPKKQSSMSEKDKAAREKEKEKEKENEKAKTGDRTAHNDIERKYRTNLKDRIAELRDAVPALQTINEDGGVGDDDNGSQPQPARAPKVSKGTVLTKATEYIHYLERRNKQIVQEHRELSKRLQAFEQLLNNHAQQQYQMPSYSRTLFDPRGFC
ncbi:helix-loop-helix DNA-binding domain-containing protein [Diplogelasinospora grovesii]|uniref:Helix-loop-helix DNA-binding domain-containing protein n=1 Tax=Diplogelasinospora grovesii TaxID=303347 RepID=A0AAN6N328_9PEZI|nr:helix-loop-helix DNA-binding domain-containing protein [Diplogelasinospora grovesii]